MSFAASLARRSSRRSTIPSANVTLMCVAPSTTWRAVRICAGLVDDDAAAECRWWAGSRREPGVASVLVSVSIRTSDGWIVLNTSSERGGPGVCDASTLSTVSTTWRCVMPGLAGNSAA